MTLPQLFFSGWLRTVPGDSDLFPSQTINDDLIIEITGLPASRTVPAWVFLIIA